MLGPTTCAVEKRGSSTVKRAASRIDLDAQVPPRHEPAIEHRDPRDRLALPKAGQRSVRIRVELLERQRSAEWEPSFDRAHRR